ncbi:Peroxisomal 2,4-dienoyl-CoA reductase [Bulinus truncatus]|nr:Peroxisomal 2,4-dienoyl-CoA reductase [Bulinus truncatus]
MSEAVPEEKCLENYVYNFRKDIIKDKVALITGGGSGICFTIAEIFMRHGCHTAIAGRNLDRLKKSAHSLHAATGYRCLPIQMDVRKPQDVIAGVEIRLKKYGRIDILINGAAGNFLCPLEKMSFNAFKTVIEIDTLGTYNVSKVVYDQCFKFCSGIFIYTIDEHAKAMEIEQKRIGSWRSDNQYYSHIALYRNSNFQAHVGSAKAAIEALTRHQALEWGLKVSELCA